MSKITKKPYGLTVNEEVIKEEDAEHIS